MYSRPWLSPAWRHPVRYWQEAATALQARLSRLVKRLRQVMKMMREEQRHPPKLICSAIYSVINIFYMKLTVQVPDIVS